MSESNGRASIITALGALAGNWLFWVDGVRNRGRVALIVVGVVLIWPFLMVTGVHPLFPYGVEFSISVSEKYGAGRYLCHVDVAWNVVMTRR